MSNKKGKAMSNLPIHYIQAMEELQEENNKLRLELQGLKTKVNVTLGSVSKCLHPYKKVVSGDDGMWCTECNKYITTF